MDIAMLKRQNTLGDLFNGAGAPALSLNVTCVIAMANISGTQVAGGSLPVHG